MRFMGKRKKRSEKVNPGQVIIFIIVLIDKFELRV